MIRDFLDVSNHSGLLYVTILDDPSGVASAVRAIETADIDMGDRIEFVPGSRS